VLEKFLQRSRKAPKRFNFCRYGKRPIVVRDSSFDLDASNRWRSYFASRIIFLCFFFSREKEFRVARYQDFRERVFQNKDIRRSRVTFALFWCGSPNLYGLLASGIRLVLVRHFFGSVFSASVATVRRTLRP